ncbi:MAG: hypothetical protein ACOCQN_00610 [Halanaerobiaceae bacterium]
MLKGYKKNEHGHIVPKGRKGKGPEGYDGENKQEHYKGENKHQ